MKITQQQLKDVLHYSPETGIFTWLPRKAEKDSSIWWVDDFNEKHAGRPAGSIKKSELRPSYVRIQVHRTHYFAHRLAWLYMTGCSPPRQVDHRDGDGTNNRWRNLRDGSSANRYNLSRYKTNRSGVTGVHWEDGCWRAVVRHNGKRYRLGRHKEIEAAERAVEEFRASIKDFTSDHGKRLPIR